MVEVAVVRNTIAHGERCYSQRGVKRLQSVSVDTSIQPGAPVLLDYLTLHEYRARLKSLLQVAQVRGIENTDEEMLN